MTDAERTDRIDDAIAEPAAAAVDGMSATAPPIDQQIKGVTFVEGREALSGTNSRGGKKSGWNCLRPAKSVPPGAV